MKDVTRDANGNITKIKVSEYNEKGKKLSTVTRGADGAIINEEHYQELNKKGLPRFIVNLNSNHETIDFKEFEYDRKGRKTKEIKRDKAGNVVEYTTYKYSRKGVVQEITYDKDGKVQNRDEYKYNKNGFVSSIISTDSEGKYIGQDDYEYYQNGYKKREISRNSEGKAFEYTDYEYDTEGNCTKKVVRDSEGKVKHYRKYSIDDSGKRSFIKYDSSGKELDRGEATD